MLQTTSRASFQIPCLARCDNQTQASVLQPQSSSPFGASSSGGIFGASTPAFGAAQTPAFGAASSAAFGSSSFGVCLADQCICCSTRVSGNGIGLLSAGKAFWGLWRVCRWHHSHRVQPFWQLPGAYCPRQCTCHWAGAELSKVDCFLFAACFWSVQHSCVWSRTVDPGLWSAALWKCSSKPLWRGRRYLWRRQHTSIWCSCFWGSKHACIWVNRIWNR